MLSDERGLDWTTRRLTVAGSDAGVTVHELDSGIEGPNLLVLGGVHGDEVGGIVAAGTVTATAWPLVSGRLTVVPLSHEAAYEADSRTSPLDGGNLARSFPGDAAGQPTQKIARLIADELIAHADVLIDLHTGNARTDMPLFAGCVDDGSPQSDRAVGLLVGFGMSLVWTHPSPGPGRTLTTAHELGIPGLYVESPVGGVLDEGYIGGYVDGVRSVIEQLGMIEGSAQRPAPELWLHGNGDIDSMGPAPVAGLFLRTMGLMSRVRRGDLVGRILNPLGATLAEIRSPAGGYITTLQRAAVVAEGTPLVGVSQVRPARLGFASDQFQLPLPPAICQEGEPR